MPLVNNKVTEAYNKAYIAMLEEDDESYNIHCTSFYTVLDANDKVEAYIIESLL